MSTFRLGARLTSFSGLSGYDIGAGFVGSPPSNPQLLTIINRYPLDANYFGRSTTNGNISMFPDSDLIYLNGSGTPITDQNIPVGFNVTAASFTPSYTFGGATITLNLDARTTVDTGTIDFLTGELNLNNIFATAYGIAWAGVTSAFFNFYANIEGTYQIISSQFTLENLTHPGLTATDQAVAGDQMKLTTTDDSYDLSTITAIKITDTDQVTSFDSQSATQVTFTLPSSLTDGLKTMEASGTLFTGYTFLGPLTILTINASGVYTLTPGKTCDTIYVNSASGPTTTDVAIPDPTIKTGFIGG